MKLKNISESKHAELLKLLNPLLDFMIENKFNYFLVAGKSGICTRHLRGNFYDVTEMLKGMGETNAEVFEILKESVEKPKQQKPKQNEKANNRNNSNHGLVPDLFGVRVEQK